MSERYSPTPGAEPEAPFSTAFLSQRDLGLRVPINYITVPGVSLSSACFPHLSYKDDASGECLSNLLAVGFRKFELDLYWDQGRKLWSFCPVAIPNSNINADASSISPIGSSRTAPGLARSLSSASKVEARQAVSEGVSGQLSSSEASLSRSGTSLGPSLPSFSVVPNTPDIPFVSSGPYVCTSTINLPVFTSQILDFIRNTQNTLGAQMLYVILNIHAAASASSPSSPAPKPFNLPDASQLISALFTGPLSIYLYTPSNLFSERNNLNTSWYTVTEQYRPVDGYYETTINQYGIASTKSGWPSESYIEFSKSKRLVLGWGTIDPQMGGYNFSGDSETIFPSGYTQVVQTGLNTSSGGDLSRYCYLRNTTVDLTQVNSSWAAGSTEFGIHSPNTPTTDLKSLLSLASNTTNCGISPILNNTLLNSTAQDNFRPYQDYFSSTIWSWAEGQPKNATDSPDAADSLFRCATISLASSGTWSVSDCSQKYSAACQANNQPYNWTLTTYATSYSYAAQACPDEFNFAVPRTALENSYLSQEIRNLEQQQRGDASSDYSRIWVDFNSLDMEGCWVTGVNTTCPYAGGMDLTDAERQRVVVVPTVAAILILIISVLITFVKVVGNRDVRKRSRNRTDNGFVYEGVPS